MERYPDRKDIPSEKRERNKEEDGSYLFLFEEALISLRHWLELQILNGNFEWWRERKWRFSLTKSSAPTYSAYAAIRASADFNPSASYFEHISKGISEWLSMLVFLWRKSMNSLKASGVRLLRTSDTISQLIRIKIFSGYSAIVSSNSSQRGLIFPRKSGHKEELVVA